MAAVWTIEKTYFALSKGGKNNVIERAEALITDKDGEFTAGKLAYAGFQTEDLSSFKEYADVTESDVLGWVKTALGDEVAAIEKQLQDDIEVQKNPTHGNGLPWVS